MLFAGVDGGGSKTEAVLVDEKGEEVNAARSGPSNYLRVGLEHAVTNVGHALDAALAGVGAGLADLGYVYCGIAGTAHFRHRRAIQEALSEQLRKLPVEVTTDARIALEGAIGEAPGAIVISGTGSAAYALDVDGREALAGGWGPLLGDEGSGYWIAKMGLTAVVRADDGRGPATLISEELCEEHGICQPGDLKYFIYATDTRPADIAKMNQIVSSAADRDDEIAISILRQAGEELALAVEATLRSLSLTDTAVPVAGVGGAFSHGIHLRAAFEEFLEEVVPKAEVIPARDRPSVGAARLAMEQHRKHS